MSLIGLQYSTAVNERHRKNDVLGCADEDSAYISKRMLRAHWDIDDDQGIDINTPKG